MEDEAKDLIVTEGKKNLKIGELKVMVWCQEGRQLVILEDGTALRREHQPWEKENKYVPHNKF